MTRRPSSPIAARCPLSVHNPRASEAMSPSLPTVSLRAAQLAELRGTQIHKLDPAPV